jgi:hypothetical protein
MKHIQPYHRFLNEKVEMAYSTINGKKIESSWSGSADNLKDFIKLIENAPETLEYVKVTSSTSSFAPDSETFKGPINSSKKRKIIKIVKDMEKAFKAKGDAITSYRFNSYFGAGGRNHTEDPAYIDYRTKAIEQFGKDMSSGKYGSLD